MVRPFGGQRRALVFDFDGTLVDTAPDLHLALNRLLAEHGRPSVTLDSVKLMVGEGAAKLVERGFESSGELPAGAPELVRRYLELYEEGGHRLSRPYPGVADTLAGLAEAGYDLGICTNKPLRYARDILDLLGLAGRFAAVSGGDSEPVRKPHPDHLLATLRRLGADAAAAVMIGDSATDVATARAAGVTVIAVAYGYTRIPARELGADSVIDDFAQLPAALAELPPPATGY